MNNLKGAMEYLKNKYNLEKGFFCIYGSYATNTQNEDSDIDMLYIYRCNASKLKRTSENYNKIPISFYELSFKDLRDDANGKYGGFFCGKIFNPSLFVDNTNEDNKIIQNAVATFFSRLISERHCIINKNYTSDEILKNSICSYIELYPEYFSYILRLMVNDEFENIWNQWKKVYVNILISKNVIKKENNKYTYKKIHSKETFERIRIDYISRFWIYGAVSHNAKLDFYDYYKSKNKEYIFNHKNLKEKAEKFLNITYMT